MVASKCNRVQSQIADTFLDDFRDWKAFCNILWRISNCSDTQLGLDPTATRILSEDQDFGRMNAAAAVSHGPAGARILQAAFRGRGEGEEEPALVELGLPWSRDGDGDGLEGRERKPGADRRGVEVVGSESAPDVDFGWCGDGERLSHVRWD